jgi:peptidoglycan biosynthesis protein MviN/MurJ (putative lipid II flippase)
MALQVTLTLLLAAAYGLTGALIGTIVGRIVQALLLYFKTDSGKLIGANPLKMFLVPGLMTVGLSLIYANPWNGGSLVNGVAGFIISSAICVIIYYKEIPSVLKWLRPDKA